MFLDNLSKKALNIIGVTSVVLATLMIILVIVLPIQFKRILKNDYIQKCNPSLDNTNIWASFPGELDSKLLHTFSFFNYEKIDGEKNLYKINYKSNITIEEKVNYTNFSKIDNTIYFLNNRTYKNLENEKENEKTSISGINLGLFEALETVSYPPLYKIGIDSIYYLKKKVLIEPDLFIKELFTYKMSKTLSEEDIRNKILINIPPIKIDFIIESSKYSLNTSSGFFEWIKILGSQEKISKATWLNDLFLLTEEEVDSVVLDENCFLMKEYKDFNKNISNIFKCEDNCGEELLYKQLIESSVINKLFPEINNFKELITYLGYNYYPFEKTPEMLDFFSNIYSKQKGHKTDYKEVTIKKEQLEKFIKEDGKYCLLSLENSINILHVSKTADSKKDIKYFDDLTYDNVNFLSEYFYSYLPSIFLLPEKKENEEDIKEEAPKSIGLMSKIVSNFLPKIVEQTFKKMSNIDILSYLEEKMYFIQMKEVLKTFELEDICPIIMQKSLNDPKKVFKVCSDEKVNLNSEESLNKFIQLYFCQEETKDEKKCNNSISNYLKSIINVTDEEISSLVSKNSYIAQIIISSPNALSNKYNCPGPCTNEYLLRIQYAKAKVTRDPPEPLEKADSLKVWFPELEDDYEIIKIKEKKNNTEPFEEEDVFRILDSYISNGDLFDVENSEAFMNKITFEKDYSNALMNKPKDSSLYKLIEFLLGIYVFDKDNKNNSLIVNYSSVDDFVKGNSIENQYWIEYLQSGNYYENFKPNLSSVTEFYFGFDFATKEQKDLNLDYIGISARTNEYNKRRIEKINDLVTLNIKKSEYDITKDSDINLNFPLYNFQKLLGDRIFSDGFQYDNSLEVIYYYDLISSRPLRFNRKEVVKYKDKLECKKYLLDTEKLSAEINEDFDSSDNKAMLTQKVNKPFALSVNYKGALKKFGYEYDDNNNEDNYICVDPISDMVIDSKINLMYSLNSRKYGLLNKNIESNTLYPLFHYQRNYEVNINSYEKQFPGVTEFYEKSTTLIVVGVILIIVFVAVAVVAFIYLNKKIKREQFEEMQDNLEPIVPDVNYNVNENKSKEE